MAEILKAISDYGLAFVIAAIAIYGVFRVMNVYIKKIESAALVHSPKKAEEKHNELLEVRRAADPQIRLSLDRLLLRSGADRAFVFEFHNGGTNICGLPFLRMTNTYESLAAGMPSRILTLAQLPSSILHPAAGDILMDSIKVIQNDDDPSVGHQLAVEYMNKTGLYTTVLARITNVAGVIVGFCGIDFRSADDDRDLEELQAQVGIVAVELGGLLSVEA